jgi:hypothetical protein
MEMDIGNECPPLQFSRGDDCYLHLELARLLYSEESALRNLQKLQLFFSFSEEIDLDDSEDDDERPVPRPSHRELDFRHQGYALIVQRAVCNLVRLELLDQHQLETLLYQAKDNDGIYYNFWYTVSLTRTSYREESASFPPEVGIMLILCGMQ